MACLHDARLVSLSHDLALMWLDLTWHDRLCTPEICCCEDLSSATDLRPDLSAWLVSVLLLLQLSQAHVDHKKLRDQYTSEIMAHNADLATLEQAERDKEQLRQQLSQAQVSCSSSSDDLAAQPECDWQQFVMC